MPRASMSARRTTTSQMRRAEQRVHIERHSDCAEPLRLWQQEIDDARKTIRGLLKIDGLRYKDDPAVRRARRYLGEKL
jgi:hypothetical protein